MRFLILVVVLCVTFAACSRSESPSSPTPNPPSAQCTFSVSSTALNIAGTGGSATIAVATGNSCAWTVASSAPFVTLTSPSSNTGPAMVSFMVAANTGDARTATLTIAGQSVTVNQAAGDPVFGNWAGSIVSAAPCGPGLPTTVAWTGTIRRNAQTLPELVITVPSLGIVNQVLPLTITGNSVQFTIQVDALYTFVGTLSADRRSLTGTFTGFSCSGTWNGTRQ